MDPEITSIELFTVVALGIAIFSCFLTMRLFRNRSHPRVAATASFVVVFVSLICFGFAFSFVVNFILFPDLIALIQRNPDSALQVFSRQSGQFVGLAVIASFVTMIFRVLSAKGGGELQSKTAKAQPEVQSKQNGTPNQNGRRNTDVQQKVEIASPQDTLKSRAVKKNTVKHSDPSEIQKLLKQHDILYILGWLGVGAATGVSIGLVSAGLAGERMFVAVVHKPFYYLGFPAAIGGIAGGLWSLPRSRK